jgi:hypothetical protein
VLLDQWRKSYAPYISLYVPDEDEMSMIKSAGHLLLEVSVNTVPGAMLENPTLDWTEFLVAPKLRLMVPWKREEKRPQTERVQSHIRK